MSKFQQRIRQCHYCCSQAQSDDHIVARCYLRRKGVPESAAMLNKVPACLRCNSWKKNLRSDCECETCRRAWEAMAPYLLPLTKSKIEVVVMSARPDLEVQQQQILVPNWAL